MCATAHICNIKLFLKNTTLQITRILQKLAECWLIGNMRCQITCNNFLKLKFHSRKLHSALMPNYIVDKFFQFQILQDIAWFWLQPFKWNNFEIRFFILIPFLTRGQKSFFSFLELSCFSSSAQHPLLFRFVKRNAKNISPFVPQKWLLSPLWLDECYDPHVAKAGTPLPAPSV